MQTLFVMLKVIMNPRLPHSGKLFFFKLILVLPNHQHTLTVGTELGLHLDVVACLRNFH